MVLEFACLLDLKKSNPQWIQIFTEVGVSANENRNICLSIIPSHRFYIQLLKFNYQTIAVYSFHFCCIPQTGRANTLMHIVIFQVPN